MKTNIIILFFCYSQAVFAQDSIKHALLNNGYYKASTYYLKPIKHFSTSSFYKPTANINLLYYPQNNFEAFQHNNLNAYRNNPQHFIYTNEYLLNPSGARDLPSFLIIGSINYIGYLLNK